MEKKKYVRIQSKTNIQVTSGLQFDDVTNPDAHVADRLKISSLWPKTIYFIKEGVGVYPAEIAEWPTVKALEKDQIITISSFTNELEAKDADVEAKRKDLLENLEAFEEKKEEKKAPKKLADIIVTEE